MTRLFITILATITLFSGALLAASTGPTGPTGPDVPATPEAAVELGQTAYAAINSGDYMVAVPPLLMILVWLFNAVFKGMISRRFLPGCSVSVAVIAAVAFNLSTMPADVAWWTAVLKALALGLTVGPAASGLWSLVGKKLLVKKASPAAAEPPK